MSNIDQKFPIYRKTVNSRNFYCVISQNRLIEIQAVGSRWLRHEMVAEILPMRLLLEDVIACIEGVYIESSPEEFMEISNRVISSVEKP